MVAIERIVELAGAGIPSTAIATSVGCDVSYVSQVLDREEVQAQVQELRAAVAAKRVEHDNSIQSAEEIALRKVHTLLPMETDLMKATKVFQVLNAARKSTDVGLTGNQQGGGTVVHINLPAAAHLHFKLTADQQVIEIEGRSMVPMPSHQVAARMREQRANRMLEAVQQQIVDMPAITQRTRSIVDQL